MGIDSHPERVSNLREFADNYDWSGLQFPVLLKQIGKFEAKNDISVNVLGLEGKDIYILRNLGRSHREINLLMISKDGINHGMANKSLSRLLRSSNTKHKCKQYFCTNCLQGFLLEASRDEHRVYCDNNETIRVEMPRKGSKIEFCNGQNQFKVPFIMYADFESILEPVESPNPDPNQPYSQNVNQHVSTGWCVYSKFTNEKLRIHLKLYRGKDCIEKFCDYIRQEAHRLYHKFPEKPMDPLTKKQWKRYKCSTACHICFKPFNYKEPKVRDHCHYTEGLPTLYVIRGIGFLPTFQLSFIILSGYDAHLFIRRIR